MNDPHLAALRLCLTMSTWFLTVLTSSIIISVVNMQPQRFTVLLDSHSCFITQSQHSAAGTEVYFIACSLDSL